MSQPISPARRFSSRVETPQGVWVDWRFAGGEDISRVLNMSFGGLFVETRMSRGLGSTVKLEFLVQEGQIRADAVVRRVELGYGLALKFTAVSDQDSPRLAVLITGSAVRPDPPL
jgi:PilZ domain